MRSAAIGLSLLLTTSLAGCAGPGGVGPRNCIPANSVAMVRTELYFGLSRPDGGTVTDDDWGCFLNDEITPRFPQGLTVIDVHGQWQQEDGKIAREPTRVVILVHPATAATNRDIEAIRDRYKTLFAQEAVMRLDSREAASF